MAGIIFKTAGESHGRGLVAIVEGVPYGVMVDEDLINRNLARRQRGYGRSARQQIETDRVEILTGLRAGMALGGPITLWVANADHRIDRYRTMSQPRPGHADLAGALKYGTDNVADIMERASARETAARVAAGGLAQSVLAGFGVDVFGYVCAIGSVDLLQRDEISNETHSLREASEFLSLDPEGDVRAKEHLDQLKEAGDTVGGRFRVVATGLPPGLGDHTQWDRRLNGRLAQALMSIQAMKAVEIGQGVESGRIPGSDFQDAIYPGEGPGGTQRRTNNAGGLEGGITNGEPLVVTVTMKPIPTLLKRLPSVDLVSGEAGEAVYERSDVCAVPAAGVVGEAMVALTLLDAWMQKFGGDSLEETRSNWASFLARLEKPSH